jgi:hypothetical protein
MPTKIIQVREHERRKPLQQTLIDVGWYRRRQRIAPESPVSEDDMKLHLDEEKEPKRTEDLMTVCGYKFHSSLSCAVCPSHFECDKNHKKPKEDRVLGPCLLCRRYLVEKCPGVKTAEAFEKECPKRKSVSDDDLTEFYELIEAEAMEQGGDEESCWDLMENRTWALEKINDLSEHYGLDLKTKARLASWFKIDLEKPGASPSKKGHRVIGECSTCGYCIGFSTIRGMNQNCPLKNLPEFNGKQERIILKGVSKSRWRCPECLRALDESGSCRIHGQCRRALDASTLNGAWQDKIIQIGISEVG